jgi:hypothetical protein
LEKNWKSSGEWSFIKGQRGTVPQKGEWFEAKRTGTQLRECFKPKGKDEQAHKRENSLKRKVQYPNL